MIIMNADKNEELLEKPAYIKFNEKMKNFIERKPYYQPLGLNKKANWFDRLVLKIKKILR